MTDFTPTHRTNRAIGNIKAGSPIRVAQYDDMGFFSDLLGQLGAKNDHIEYRYFEEDVQFWDPRDLDRTSRYVLPDDYVITDGEHFEVSGTDFGWDLLPTRKVSGTEDVTITFHETYYCLHGKESGTVLRMTPKDILSLADDIKEFVPEPSPLDEARFIRAAHTGPTSIKFRSLAKVDGLWYSSDGEAYTQEQVLDNYDAFEVIV